MFTHRQRHVLHRTIVPTIVFVALILPVFAAMPDLAAQQDMQIQANPTETPAGPGGFQVNPTAEPTEELPIRVNPTAEPTEELPIRVNPTAEPTEELPIQANPTEAPAIDDFESNPVSGTVRVVTRDCPMGVVEDAMLTDYLTICTQPHDGVEFVVNDVNSAQAGVTSGGEVEWTGVDSGVFNITETLPDGYTDPIVFCGYTESPGGGVQHPSLQDATGGVVAGEFPPVLFEYVCYWMNIKQTTGVIGGPDVIANPQGDGLSQFWLRKRSCPAGIAPHQDFNFYYEECTTVVDGISFSLKNDEGSSTKSIESGEATWTGLPLGPFTLEEDIPAMYGEPIAFCGWSAFWEGIIYDAFAQPTTVTDGVIQGEISIPNTGYFCFMYNVPSGPGGLVDPGSSLSELDLRKWICPDGTARDEDRDYYLRECQLATMAFEFTLNNADGSSTESTSSGWAHWSGLPTGPFTLEETIPEGFGSPVAFCGWYAYWGGYIYDAFPAPTPAPGGVIEGEITIPNSTWFCDVFNMEGGIDDFQANPTEVPRDEIDDLQANPTEKPTDEIDDLQANPTEAPAIDDIQGNGALGTMRVVKRSCPLGVVEDAFLSEYLKLCPQVQDGVEFTLDEGGDSQSGVTSAGEVEWTGVDSGPFTLTETIPAGYTDPIVFCGYTESPGGGVQHPSLQDAGDGVMQGSFPEAPFEYVCYVMNIKQTSVGIGGPDVIANPQGDGDSTFWLSKRTCPAGIEADQLFSYYQEMCTEVADGIQFTLNNDDGSSTKPIVSGDATWTGLPLGPFTLEEDIPTGFGEPIVFCGWTAFWEGKVYDAFTHQLPAPGGVIEGEITVPNTYYFCYVMNVRDSGVAIGGPDVIANPEDLTNTLVARKWLCPAGIDRGLDLWELFRRCELSSSPVEFTLDNADGVSTQATSGGKVQWDDVPLGPFTIQETVPVGYEDPFVWCGGTAFYMGAVYDDFHKLVPSANGMVEGELVIPNTHHLCHFFNAETKIDDFQANPTEAPGIDGLQANPTEAPGIDGLQANPSEPASLIVRTWICPSGYDPLAGSATDDCTEAHNGVTFDLLNHAQAQPDFQAITGDSVDGAAVFAPLPGTYSLIEQIPEGYGTPFLWSCTGLDIPGALEPPFSTINFFRIVAVSNQVVECDWMNVPNAGVVFDGADDFQANPTEEPGIDDFQANPVDSTHDIYVHAQGCPEGLNPTGSYWDGNTECDVAVNDVAFVLTTDTGSFPGTFSTDDVQLAWSGVDLGDSGTIQIAQDTPDGYSEPTVWCVSFPVAAGDAQDFIHFSPEVTDGVVSVQPEQHEPYKFSCVFYNIPEEEAADQLAS